MNRFATFSLRTRLLFAVTVAVGLALAVASFVTRTSLERFLISRANERLATATETIEHSLESRASFDDGPQQLRDLVVEGTVVQIRSATGEITTSFRLGGGLTLLISQPFLPLPSAHDSSLSNPRNGEARHSG